MFPGAPPSESTQKLSFNIRFSIQLNAVTWILVENDRLIEVFWPFAQNFCLPFCHGQIKQEVKHKRGDIWSKKEAFLN